MLTQRGIGLVAVLVALAILSVGLLSLGTFQVTTVRESALAKQHTTALQLAQTRLDELRDMAHSDELLALADGSDTPTVDGVNYQRSWTITPRSDGALDIDLTVTWPDPDDANGAASDRTTVRMATVIGNYLPDTQASTVVSEAPPITLTTTTTTCSGGSGMMGGGCGGGMM